MRLVATISAPNIAAALLALAACGGSSTPIQPSTPGLASVPEPVTLLSAHCRAADDTMKRVWNRRIRDAIGASFGSTTRPYAGDTATRIATTLDDYASAIANARGELCRVELDDPESVTGDAHFCLDRRISLLVATTDLFIESVTEDIVDKAVRVTYELDPITSCTDTDSVAVAPEDDDARHELVNEWAANDEVRVRMWVAAYPAAYERLLPLVSQKTGIVNLDVERAVLHAELAGRVTTLSARRIVVEASLALVTEAGDVAARDSVMIRRVALAGTAEARKLGAELHTELSARDDTADAIGRLLEVLGDKEQSAGKHAEAFDDFRHASIARTEALGEHHPAVADVLIKASKALGEQSKYSAAAEYAERAADVYTAAFGPDHLITALARYDQGWHLEMGDQFARAVVAYEAALAARERAYSLGEVEVTWVQRRIVETLTSAGKLVEAEKRARAMFDRAEGALPDDSLGMAQVSKMLGRVLWHRQNWDEAESYFGRALDIRREMLPEMSIDITWSIHDIGDVRCGRGDYVTGLEHYQDAYTRFLSHGYKRYIAHIRWDIARCLWSQGKDKKRALELAAMARDGYAPIDAGRSLEIGAWLQEQGVTK